MGKFLVFSFLFLNLISHAADNRDIKFENFFDAEKLTIKDITQYKNGRANISFYDREQDYWCSNKTITNFAPHDVVDITYARHSLGACIQDWILKIDLNPQQHKNYTKPQCSIQLEGFFDAKKLTIKDITQYKNGRAIIHFDGMKQDYWCSNKTIDAFASHDVVNITYARTSLGACIQDWILEIDFDEASQSHADLLSKKLYYFLFSHR